MSSRPLRRALLASLTSVAVVGGLGVATPEAVANPAGTGLVISEVYGGGGNTGGAYRSDFIELYNPTGAAISLTGVSVQYRSAAGTSGGTPVALSGSVAAGGHYLIKAADGTGTSQPALPTPDATTTFSMSAMAGQVLLINGSSFSGTGNVAGNPGLVDMVGYGGSSTTTYETAPAVATANATSINRGASGGDTDNNSADLTVAAPTPENAARPLTATKPADQTGTVGQPITSFQLAATGGTPPYFWTGTGLPPGVSVATDGTVSGTPSSSGTFTPTVTVTDSATPAASASTGFTFRVAASATLTPIADIQGSTDTSPYAGQTVSTEGVVTAAYPTGGLNGFYLQTGGTPDTPGESDGIFVYGGSTGFSTYPAVGDTVDVTGSVSEYFGLTEITATTSGVTAAATQQPAVVPLTEVPGTDCALPGDSCLTGTALDAAREADESELVRPTGDYTVTDAYDGSPSPSTSSSFFGEIGLAADSADPLQAPTEVADAQDHTATGNRTAYNNAHLVVLDDGSSLNYSSSANTGKPFPWLTKTHTVRVGAAVSFPAPTVLTYANSEWKLEPQHQVTDAGTDAVTFAQDRPAAPDNVGGNLKLATFNVLNYFTTLGADEPSSAGCTSYDDRAGNPITVNSCSDIANGPRGAWTQASLDRQQAKIVHAINAIGADVMSLEEIENSLVVDGADRDSALATLVAALNADAGTTRWAYVPSPSTLPSGEDVIRTAFIYDPNTVTPVGDSEILIGKPSFDVAREPLAQRFKKVDQPDSSAFGVIVNHFKSKGSGNPDPDGQGNSNDTRIAEANDLLTFASDFKAEHGLTQLFLSGDFNAYSMEDPVQIIEGGGYTDLGEQFDPADRSYNFGGLEGSLDHVFADTGALALVTGADIWQINANESVYYEYSRFNSNVTDLYDDSPYRASDHNPEIVGLNVPDAQVTPVVSAGDVSVVYGKAKPVKVTVRSTGGFTPTGTVTITDENGTVLASAPVSATGRSVVTLPAGSLAPGAHTLTATYSGDDHLTQAATTLTATVSKAGTRTVVKTRPKKVRAGVTDVTLTATVTAQDGSVPTGPVTVTVTGQQPFQVDLVGGTATADLGSFAQPGDVTITVEYDGTDTLAASTGSTSLHVT